MVSPSERFQRSFYSAVLRRHTKSKKPRNICYEALVCLPFVHIVSDMMSSHEGLYREYISYPTYSLSRAAQSVTVLSKDAAKIHFFRKVCEKK